MREVAIEMGLALGTLAGALAVSLLSALVVRGASDSAKAEHLAIVSILLAFGIVVGAMALFRRQSSMQRQRTLVVAVAALASIGVADTQTQWMWTVPGVLACWILLFVDLGTPARFAVMVLHVPATGLFLLDIGGVWAETPALVAVLVAYHLLAWLTVPAHAPWKQAPLWPLAFGGLMAIGIALYYIVQGVTSGRLQLLAVVAAFDLLLAAIIWQPQARRLRVRPPIRLAPATAGLPP